MQAAAKLLDSMNTCPAFQTARSGNVPPTPAVRDEHVTATLLAEFVVSFAGGNDI